MAELHKISTDDDKKDGGATANDAVDDSIFDAEYMAKFAALNKLVRKDMNDYFNRINGNHHYFDFSRKDVIKYIADPCHHEKELRDAMITAYAASTHFRRLIQYFVGLTDWAYVVQPYKIDPKKSNARTTNINYRRVLNVLSSMNIPTQFPNILTTCLREDVYYGTMWITNDDITIQQLPSDYCTIATIEGGVPNVTFDFSYFDTRQNLLNFFPQEFRTKYDIYKQSTTVKAKRRNNSSISASTVLRWQELDSPTSFAVKCNTDILDYAVPPFIGLLRDLYDIEDFKDMSLTKEQMQNYALLAMTLPTNSDGSWGIDLKKAYGFWGNLNDVLPESVGSVLTPMPINKISFERERTGDSDTVAKAEQNLFTEAGVSSLLFNNERASANALSLSIKADQAITYKIVKSIGDVVNRYIHSLSYGKNFIVNFLDVSRFNRKEVGDSYLKAASYGFPTLSAYAASQGIGQAELDSMNFLEKDVLGLNSSFVPLQNSSTISASESTSISQNGTLGDPGAPSKDIGELSDKREVNSENE